MEKSDYMTDESKRAKCKTKMDVLALRFASVEEAKRWFVEHGVENAPTKLQNNGLPYGVYQDERDPGLIYSPSTGQGEFAIEMDFGKTKHKFIPLRFYYTERNIDGTIKLTEYALSCRKLF